MSYRIAQINSFLSQEISQLLQKELSFKKGLLVSVSKVETSSDLRHSKIFVSVLPEQDAAYVLATLKKEIFSLQGKLNKKMATKILPRLNFVLDKRLEKVDQIEELFQEIEREKEACTTV